MSRARLVVLLPALLVIGCATEVKQDEIAVMKEGDEITTCGRVQNFSGTVEADIGRILDTALLLAQASEGGADGLAEARKEQFARELAIAEAEAAGQPPTDFPDPTLTEKGTRIVFFDKKCYVEVLQ